MVCLTLLLAFNLAGHGTHASAKKSNRVLASGSGVPSAGTYGASEAGPGQDQLTDMSHEELEAVVSVLPIYHTYFSTPQSPHWQMRFGPSDEASSGRPSPLVERPGRDASGNENFADRMANTQMTRAKVTSDPFVDKRFQYETAWEFGWTLID
jgi:hypothetical protein